MGRKLWGVSYEVADIVHTPGGDTEDYRPWSLLEDKVCFDARIVFSDGSEFSTGGALTCPYENGVVNLHCAWGAAIDIDDVQRIVLGDLVLWQVSIVIAVLAIMLYFSVWMTLVLLVGVAAMFYVTKTIGGGSAKYFMKAQKAVGAMEGFAQEMMDGQKVIKVFCHEKQSLEDFDRVNDELRDVAFRANAYASTLGPIIANIGNILYVGLALAGGVFILAGIPNLSLSGKIFDITVLIPFLNMSRQFTGNVNQLSQQINSVVMAGAGAQRVLTLVKEKPETDDGYVTLVNAAEDADGSLHETEEHTGHWAWRHPHTDGSGITYTPLRGDVRMVDVDFAYNHNMSCTTCRVRHFYL